mmetsp:Transcript_23129/g.32657  ORF Transcript_23129/g.32657 Transcript_23129/m.32657 type:complete len:215 (-) Transcript_23129:683-1327(-)
MHHTGGGSLGTHQIRKIIELLLQEFSQRFFRNRVFVNTTNVDLTIPTFVCARHRNGATYSLEPGSTAIDFSSELGLKVELEACSLFPSYKHNIRFTFAFGHFSDFYELPLGEDSSFVGQLLPQSSFCPAGQIPLFPRLATGVPRTATLVFQSGSLRGRCNLAVRVNFFRPVCFSQFFGCRFEKVIVRLEPSTVGLGCWLVRNGYIRSSWDLFDC